MGLQHQVQVGDAVGVAALQQVEDAAFRRQPGHALAMLGQQCAQPLRGGVRCPYLRLHGDVGKFGLDVGGLPRQFRRLAVVLLLGCLVALFLGAGLQGLALAGDALDLRFHDRGLIALPGDQRRGGGGLHGALAVAGWQGDHGPQVAGLEVTRLHHHPQTAGGSSGAGDQDHPGGQFRRRFGIGGNGAGIVSGPAGQVRKIEAGQIGRVQRHQLRPILRRWRGGLQQVGSHTPPPASHTARQPHKARVIMNALMR